MKASSAFFRLPDGKSRSAYQRKQSLELIKKVSNFVDIK